MDDPIRIAMEMLAQNYSCAQSILSAFGPAYGMDEETALRTAVCFGAGMSRLGRDCGAVTGALMALGLAYGEANPDQAAKNLAYGKAQEYIRRFKERRGTIVCRELVGYDLSDDAQLKEARDRGVFIKVCTPLVREAAELLAAMLPPK
jgi:C_GCAxxG_C_C family probable redox protein